MKNRVARVLAVLLAVVMAVSSLPFYGTGAKAAVKARLVKTSASIVIGQKVKIKSIVPKGASVSYQSADKKIASVSAKGKVTGIRAGKTKITVTVKEGKSKKKLIYKVNVKKPKLSKKTQNILKGKTVKLSVKNKPKKAKYKWSSSNKKVAAVTKKGKVTGKKNGTAVIKVKCFSGKKFSYTLSCKVKVVENSAGSHELSIEVENELADIDSETDVIVTQEEQLLLKGKVTGNDTVEKMEVTYSDYTEEEKKADVTGITDWSVKIPLEIGTNIVQISAKGTYTGDVKKKVIINRTNKTITYNENVKIAEEKDYKQLEDGITACWVDENGTKDASDDTMVLLVKEESLLLQQIRDGELQQGDVYMLPQSETFVTGFTAVYERHQAPRGTEDYPVEDYPDNAFEEIIFNYPSYADLFSEDVSLDFTGGIDEENPIAFAMLPDGTPLDVKVEKSEKKASDTDTILPDSMGNQHMAPFSDQYNLYQSEDENYPKAGWQPKELAKNLMPSLKKVYNVSNKSFDFTLNWEDVVLYDEDGSKKTENDQLKLCGELGIKDFKQESFYEWHPIKKRQLLPRQIMNKINYDFVGAIELKGDVSVEKSLADNEDSKHHFKNENKLCKFIKLSGVESFEDKWMIGSIGVNVITDNTVWGAGMDKVQVESKKYPVSPIVVLYLFLDINGKLTLESSISYTYEASCTKGFNLQKDGFDGGHGSQEENKGEKHGELPLGYTWDVYDKNETEHKLNFGGKVDASLDLGIGMGAGLMLFGICPGTVYGELFFRFEGKAEEEMQIFPEPASTASVSAYCGLGIKADADIRLLAECLGSKDIEVEIKPWEHFFWEKELLPSKHEYNGHVYQLYDQGCTWEEAKKYCEEKGGYLVTISSSDEQEFIENFLKEEGEKNNYWLGGYKNSSNLWQWLTGEPFDYTNWANGQPDSYRPYGASGEEDTLMMYKEENEKNPAPLGKWNDIRKDGTCGDEEFFGTDNFGYICEWDYLK